MSNASRGASFERRVKKWLESNHWWVIRAAGSHGEADLVAIRPGRVVLIQCKIGECSTREAEGLLEIAEKIDGQALVATAIRGGFEIETARDLIERRKRHGRKKKARSYKSIAD